MLIYGHRGASARLPENTLASLYGAIEDGADGIEFDVRATADGVPVLLHDRDLGRTTDAAGPIDGRIAADLIGVDAGDGKTVPTLNEALAAVGGCLFLDIEVKQAGIEEQILAVLDSHLLKGYVLSSFDWDILRAFHRLDPEVPIWPLAMVCDDALLAVAGELASGGVALAAAAYDESASDRLHAARLDVAVWTVNVAAEARRVRDLGAAILISDDPAAIRVALAAG